MKGIKAFGIFMIFSAVIVLAAPRSACQEGNVNAELEEFDFANGLFSRGMYDMAADEYKNFLKKYPESRYAETAGYRIAECYFLDGKYGDALDSFSVFLEQYPSGDLANRAVLRRGQIYYLKDNYREAESILSGLAGAHNAGEAEMPARYYLAGIYLRQGDNDRARKTLEGILSRFGEGEYTPFVHMSLGDIYKKAEEYLKAAEEYSKAAVLSADEEFVGQARLRAGGVYYLAGDYAKARSFYVKITDKPGEPEVFDSAALGLFAALYGSGEYGLVAEYSESLLPRVKSAAARSQILFIIGNSYFSEDRFSEARKAYAEAFRMYPDTEFGLKSKLNESWALYKSGRFDDCLRSVETYIDSGGDSLDEALYVRAIALAGAGRTADALRVYREITERFKGSGLYKEVLYEMGWLHGRSGHPLEAAGYYRTFAEAYPEDPRSPALLLKAGQENLKLERYEAAEKDYTAFLSRFADSPLKENVLFQLGMVYSQQQDHDRSIEVYERFVEEFPRSEARDSAVYNTGREYQKKQEWDRAIEFYSGLISAAKGAFYERSMESAAYCYFQKGEYKAAAEAYYGLMTEAADVKLPEGVCRWVADFFLNSGESERSIEILEILSKKYPDTGAGGEVSYMFAENYRCLEDWEAAIKYFQKAIDKKVSSPYLERSYLGLGRVYSAMGDNEKALTFLNKALEDHKDNMTGAFARFEIGNVNFRMMKFEEAARQFMMVAILYKDEDLCPEALFQAGVSFDKAGKAQKAVDVFKELREKYPGNVLSKDARREIRRIKSETG
ncbi:MAG: hypothetical protein DRP85_06200 [Candidatus Makaraimicrobium thalassicum]|nr:MAG: hypothetical protein DRP85_06200 [Candidatus Omnitrophota bacterium]